MFGIFGKKEPQKITSTLVFDEAYCHSSGEASQKTYLIEKGTTDLCFSFPDFDSFWQTHINRNQQISDETLIALRDQQAVFTISVVDNGQYQYHNGVGEDGTVTLNAANLQSVDHGKRLTQFSGGVLAFGIYHIGAYRFEVVWATLYAEE
jgi:hypothetical protein